MLALVACDRALNLAATAPADGADAAFFDAAILTSCPPPGTTPLFSPKLVQTVTQNCFSYTRSPRLGVAAAICTDDMGKNYIASGPVDMPLSVAVGMDDPSTCANRNSVELSADGIASVSCSGSSFQPENREYAYQPNGTWVKGLDLMPATGNIYDLAALTSTTPQRLLYWNTGDRNLYENEGTIGNWTQVAMTPTTSLGLNYLTWIAVTSDGLRLVMQASTSTDPIFKAYYTDRPDLSSAWRPAERLLDVPLGGSLYMTDDCSRVYISGLQNIFFVDQIPRPRD